MITGNILIKPVVIGKTAKTNLNSSFQFLVKIKNPIKTQKLNEKGMIVFKIGKKIRKNR